MNTVFTKTPLIYRQRRGQEGMAVIVVMALFAIMLIFLGMSFRSLNHLRTDLKLIERQQLQRIHQHYGRTNSVSLTNDLANPTASVLESSWTSSPPFVNR